MKLYQVFAIGLVLPTAYSLVAPRSRLFRAAATTSATRPKGSSSVLHATPVRPNTPGTPTATFGPNAIPINAEAPKEPETVQRPMGEVVKPLDENWWPGTTVGALDKSKPNAVELLGQPYVIFWNGIDWKCMQDFCSHRFGPLSQGNVIETEGGMFTLQCGSHGWEFDDAGICKHVPQQVKKTTDTDVASVTACPLQVEAGIIWIWTGGDTPPPEDATLPVSPLLQKWHAQYGNDCVFMRDVACGMELLGESLVDVSQLPFLHHSKAGMDREKATSIDLKLVFPPNDGAMYQAELQNAASADPIFQNLNLDIAEKATSFISYFPPNHFRIHRQREWSSSQDFFLVPIAQGKTRMFYFNPLECALKGSNNGGFLLSSIQRKLLDPTTVRTHMFIHDMFDSDGAFLQLQGDRMKRSDLTYKDYSTPSSADLMVTAYRQYMEDAVKKTNEDPRKDTLANSVRIADLPPGMDPQPVLLDRQSHTQSCRVCQAALKKTQRLHKRLEVLLTAFVGASGASSVMALTIGLASRQIGLNITLMKTVLLSAFFSAVAALGVSKWKERTMHRLQRYFFEGEELYSLFVVNE